MQFPIRTCVKEFMDEAQFLSWKDELLAGANEVTIDTVSAKNNSYAQYSAAYLSMLREIQIQAHSELQQDIGVQAMASSMEEANTFGINIIKK